MILCVDLGLKRVGLALVVLPRPLSQKVATNAAACAQNAKSGLSNSVLTNGLTDEEKKAVANAVVLPLTPLLRKIATKPLPSFAAFCAKNKPSPASLALLAAERARLRVREESGILQVCWTLTGRWLTRMRVFQAALRVSLSKTGETGGLTALRRVRSQEGF